MKLHRGNAIIFLLVALFASSGCLGFFGDSSSEDYERAEKALREEPGVQEFLEENSKAEVDSSLEDKDRLLSGIDDISEKCDSNLDSDKYYRVEISLEEQKYVGWVNSNSFEVVCTSESSLPMTCDSVCPGGSASDECLEAEKCETMINLGSAASMVSGSCEDDKVCCCRGENGEQNLKESSDNICEEYCDGEVLEEGCITREQCETLISVGRAEEAVKGDCGAEEVCCCQ